MTVSLTALRNKDYKIPPVYLVILGLLLIVIGAGFDITNLINLGTWFFIVGFHFSFLWNAIFEIKSLEKNKN